MKVLILCGGKGSRLKEQMELPPKPMIEIGEKPLLWHLMKIYQSNGFNQFVLCLGYKGEVIREYFQSRREQEGWEIIFVDTGIETNTGGRLKKAATCIREDPSFMATYGDGLADIDIRRLVEFHNSHGRIGTLTAVKPPSPFGLLEIDRGDIVKSFREKPILNEWINGGFFVFRREIFEYLGDNDILERQPMERLAREGQMMAFRHEKYWRCMDTYKDTIELNEDWNKGNSAWKIW